MSFGEFIATPNSKLILHLNGNSNDSSGNGLNGTDTNVTYGKQYGKFNDGGLFNGSTSKIALPSSTNLDLQSFSHTTISWVKISGYVGSGRWYYIYGKGSYANSATYYAGRITSAGKLQHLISSNTDAQYDLFTSTASLQLGVWNNIIFTWDKPNRVIKYYLNGALMAGTMTNVGASLPVYTETANTFIGASNRGDYGFLNGNLDEVAFENKIWTQQETQKYYTNALGWF